MTASRGSWSGIGSSTTSETFDVVIAGAGIVGLAIARELSKRARVVVLEKEPAVGLHASGRNSGVLHSGIYYPAGSLKGRLCAEGAREMAAYCDEQGLPIDRLGKVILPVRADDDAQLDMLLERARSNGAVAEIVDEKQLSEIEPVARTVTGRALFSPNTAVVDPLAIVRRVASTLDVRTDQRVVGVRDGVVITDRGRFAYGLFVNAAGLHADTVAKMCGVGSHYVMLPFKGMYHRVWHLQLQRLIYPVPDLRVPFLGVHLTKAIDGEVLLGPTALPALGRENYRGLRGVSARDLAQIVLRLSRQFATNAQGFRALVRQEVGRMTRHAFAEEARVLVPTLRDADLGPSAHVGIRAQLVDTKKGELVMDFLVERGERSVHVLNAVSPGFTTAFAFARYVADMV
jgi:L-2-hydroxyglutarate oxidase LhgO